ncbi:hypothetical protein EDD11_004354 [Mortierella claussenii]|nr:hypothetical protein EDD11_004354 [Mortierella claussenii]
MGAQSISTHTVKSDATTTIVERTTTIISEHDEIFADDDHDNDSHDYHRHPSGRSVVQEVKKTLKDYWFPSHATGQSDNAKLDEDEDEEDESSLQQQDPSHFGPNSVMRRAYDYWKSLTHDAEESAKELVIKAREARDEAAKEAKWAMFGYKKEAREAYEAAEQKYRDALAAAEKAHEEALEKARSRWFQQADCTQKEVGDKTHAGGDEVNQLTHKKWDKFKAAVDSLAFNPPKYACSPSSQYWFSRQNPAADSGWDCREIWDHSSHHDHGHSVLKTLPKKHLPKEKVHSVLEGLINQANLKAKNAPSATSFEPTLKPVKAYYQGILDRISRNEKNAVQELNTVDDKIREKLNEAKYREEQTESWLISQWNAVIDNAGDAKGQYERAFKNAIQDIKKSRTDAYTAITNNLQKSVNTARTNIKNTLKNAKPGVDVDEHEIQKVIQDASLTFTDTLKKAEAKIKAAPKKAYDNAVESFNRDTAQLKARLEAAAHVAKKSGSSISHHASKSVSSHAARASQSGQDFRKDASRKLDEARRSADAIKSKASSKYDRATASVNSMWGAATPFAPLDKVQESYHQLLGDARSNFFGHHNVLHSYNELSSFYGALTALYLLFLARQIWLRRKCCPAEKEAHGDLQVTKRGRRNSHNHNHDAESSDDQHHHHSHHDRHGKHSHHEHGKHEEHGLAHRHSRHHNEHYGHHHHPNSFSAVLKTFTSVVPMTLVMLVLLELAGFSRVALHTLFAGLLASQFLRWGWFNNVMEQLGILDSALGEAVAGQSAREMGCYLAWTVFALAAAANAINVLHDE